MIMINVFNYYELLMIIRANTYTEFMINSLTFTVVLIFEQKQKKITKISHIFLLSSISKEHFE